MQVEVQCLASKGIASEQLGPWHTVPGLVSSDGECGEWYRIWVGHCKPGYTQWDSWEYGYRYVDLDWARDIPIFWKCNNTVVVLHYLIMVVSKTITMSVPIHSAVWGKHTSFEPNTCANTCFCHL